MSRDECGWAVVTGGSRGIGRAAALRLADAGHDVTIVYGGNHAAAQETADAVAERGRRARVLHLDVADGERVREALGELPAEDEPVTVLVNCAGITIDRTLAKLAVDEWQRVLDTNLSSCFHCCQAVLPSMRERRFGRIVNVASIIGQTGNVGQTNYAASKAGMIGFTKSLSLETARYDITVNAVCPGFIETEMLSAVPDDVRAALLARIPKGRFGDPDDVARAIGFLAAPASGYITGAVLNVNGGMYL
jgi:NAD(P)-dependent dehydrogenase (short-subunit alcohol dehydrogenase family)